jgi:hypothetical protein
MDCKRIITEIKLIAAFTGIFTISFLIGFGPPSGTEACLPNHNQIEFYACDEEDIKSDNLQSSFLIKSVNNNSLCFIKYALTLKELFHTRKFWLSSSSPRPPPQA